MSVIRPNQSVAITGPNGLPTNDFRRWQISVTDAVNAANTVVPVTPVPTDYLPLSTYLIGDGNISVFGSLANGGVNLALGKVANSGTGSLLGITRDEFGRVSGTTTATITGTAGQIAVANGDAVAGPPTVSLVNTAVTAASYILANVTFDAKGRATAASSNDAPSDGTTYGRRNGAWSATAGGWTTVAKTSDESRNTTTTLADDSQLLVALAAGTRYRIRFRLFYSIANATMDFKYAFAYSGAMTSVSGLIGIYEAGTAGGRSAEWQEVISALPSGALLSSAAGTGYYRLDIVVLTNTAGTLNFKWAQNTSNASNATVLAGSYLEYIAI